MSKGSGAFINFQFLLPNYGNYKDALWFRQMVINPHKALKMIPDFIQIIYELVENKVCVPSGQYCSCVISFTFPFTNSKSDKIQNITMNWTFAFFALKSVLNQENMLT